MRHDVFDVMPVYIYISPDIHSVNDKIRQIPIGYHLQSIWCMYHGHKGAGLGSHRAEGPQGEVGSAPAPASEWVSLSHVQPSGSMKKALRCWAWVTLKLLGYNKAPQKPILKTFFSPRGTQHLRSALESRSCRVSSLHKMLQGFLLRPPMHAAASSW